MGRQKQPGRTSEHRPSITGQSHDHHHQIRHGGGIPRVSIAGQRNRKASRVAPQARPSVTAPANTAGPQKARVEISKLGRSGRGGVLNDETRAKRRGSGLVDLTFREWVPPSVDVAKAHRKATLFGAGEGRLWASGLSTELSALGIGVEAYLRLVRSLAWLFAAMSVLVLFSVLTSVTGNRLSVSDQSSFSLDRFTIANAGRRRPEECEGYEDSSFRGAWWTVSGTPCPDTTVVDLPFGIGTMDAALATYVFVALDLLHTFIVSIFLVVFLRWLWNSEFASLESDINASSFAVVVKHLPPDATSEELRDHFSKLYPLSSEDWSFPGWCRCLCRHPSRLPPAFANVFQLASQAQVDADGFTIYDDRPKPVRNADLTGDPAYVGTWVAEATVSKNYGSIIRLYLKLRKLATKVEIARAMLEKAKSEPGSFLPRKCCGRKRLSAVDKALKRFAKATIQMRRMLKKYNSLMGRGEEMDLNVPGLKWLAIAEAKANASRKSGVTSDPVLPFKAGLKGGGKNTSTTGSLALARKLMKMGTGLPKEGKPAAPSASTSSHSISAQPSFKADSVRPPATTSTPAASPSFSGKENAGRRPEPPVSRSIRRLGPSRRQLTINTAKAAPTVTRFPSRRFPSVRHQPSASSIRQPSAASLPVEEPRVLLNVEDIKAQAMAHTAGVAKTLGRKRGVFSTVAATYENAESRLKEGKPLPPGFVEEPPEEPLTPSRSSTMIGSHSSHGLQMHDVAPTQEIRESKAPEDRSAAVQQDVVSRNQLGTFTVVLDDVPTDVGNGGSQWTDIMERLRMKYIQSKVKVADIVMAAVHSKRRSDVEEAASRVSMASAVQEEAEQSDASSNSSDEEAAGNSLPTSDRLRRVRKFQNWTSLLTPNNRNQPAASPAGSPLGADGAEVPTGGKAGNKSVVGFVIFEHLESRDRCVADFKRSSWRCCRLWQPRPLRLRGHSLEVAPAPEPSTILWENLDVPFMSKCCRRSLTTLLAFALITISFMIVFFTQSKRSEFSVTDSPYCTIDVPSLVLNSTSFIPPSFALKHYQQFDGGTGAAGSCLRTDDRFIIDNQGAPDDYPLTPNDCFSACTSADAATTHCTPLQCLERHLAIRNYAEANGINRDGMTSQQIANATAGVTCVPTTVATRLECYCIQSLLTALQTDGALLGPFALMDSTVCTSYAENSLIGAGMRILATLSVVSMSGLLRLIWSHVVHFERHDSEGSLSIALAWKLFIGVFVNNSVVILVTLPLGISLFGGQFAHVPPDWYRVVGPFIITTVTIDAFVPHLQVFFFAAMKYCFRRMRQKKAVTQEQLNELYEGITFDMPLRVATLLNTFFSVMFFSSVVPILIPVACLSFTAQFWVDKIALLRLYQKPAHYDISVISMAVKLMPIALLLHLVFGTWAISDSSTLPSGGITPGDSQPLAEAYAQAVGLMSPSIATALSRYAVIPYVAMLALVFLFALFMFVLWKLIKAATSACTSCLDCMGCQDESDERRNGEMKDYDDDSSEHKSSRCNCRKPKEKLALSPYTDIYGQRFCEPTQEAEVFGEDRAKGWRLVLGADGWLWVTKVWTDNGTVDLVWHQAGQYKRTWEVIRDNTFHSYNMSHNPKYRHALRMRTIVKPLMSAPAAQH